MEFLKYTYDSKILFTIYKFIGSQAKEYFTECHISFIILTHIWSISHCSVPNPKAISALKIGKKKK